jgi:hypothetical protein
MPREPTFQLLINYPPPPSQRDASTLSPRFQSWDTSPQKTTSPVATQRFNPKRTISIVGRVPTKPPPSSQRNASTLSPRFQSWDTSPQKPPPPSQRDDSTPSPRFQSWDAPHKNHLTRRNATLQKIVSLAIYGIPRNRTYTSALILWALQNLGYLTLRSRALTSSCRCQKCRSL